MFDETVCECRIGDRSVRLTDHQSEYFKAFTAFCENRKDMGPNEAAELIEHMRLMRQIALYIEKAPEVG